MNHRKGFTLIEVIVMLAVIAILAAMAVPAALRLFQVTTESATNQEMLNIQKATLGDPSKVDSSGARSDFGYLGDMGCLPTPTGTAGITSLTTIGGLPAWAFSAATQIGSGWRGPYITGAGTGPGTEVFTKDQLGNDYVYTIAGACPLTGTFTSNGPDGAAGGGDDIDYSFTAAETTATVSGYIKDLNGNPVGSSRVQINYPGGAAGPGNLTSTIATTDATGLYSFSNIPFGKRSMTFPTGTTTAPRLVVTSARAGSSSASTFCTGAGTPTCTFIEFSLVNYSTTVTPGITSLTATFSGGSFYYRINWGATNVLANTATGSGTARAITSSTVGAATSALSPFGFIVDNPSEQPPDIVIGKSGQIGTAVIVQIINFRTSNAGNASGSTVSMAGIPFTIAFNDGSTVYFTPQ